MRFIFLLLLAFGLAACGATQRPSGISISPEFSGLPALDSVRQASRVFRFHADGNEYEQGLNRNAEPAALSGVRLTPRRGPAGEFVSEGMAFAIYDFSIPGFDRPGTVSFDWQVPAAPGESFVGLSDWSHNYWRWFPVPEDHLLDLGDLGPYINDADRLLVAVVCTGGPGSVLRSLRLGSSGDWAHSFGGPGDDYFSQVLVGSDDSVYGCGGSDSFGVADEEQALLARYRKDGELLWARTLGLPGGADFRVQHWALSSDNAVYAVGSDGPPFGGDGEYNALIARVTAGGSLAWVRLLGAGSANTARAVLGLPDGSVLVALDVAQDSDADTGDIAVVRLDSSGELLSQWLIDSGGADRVNTGEVFAAPGGGAELAFRGTLTGRLVISADGTPASADTRETGPYLADGNFSREANVGEVVDVLSGDMVISARDAATGGAIWGKRIDIANSENFWFTLPYGPSVIAVGRSRGFGEAPILFRFDAATGSVQRALAWTGLGECYSAAADSEGNVLLALVSSESSSGVWTTSHYEQSNEAIVAVVPTPLALTFAESDLTIADGALTLATPDGVRDVGAGGEDGVLLKRSAAGLAPF